MYNIRDQVQTILRENKAAVDDRSPLLRISDELRAEDARLRSSRSLNAYANMDTGDSDGKSVESDESEMPGEGEDHEDDMFTTPMEWYSTLYLICYYLIS